jgi:hypothetical protein
MALSVLDGNQSATTLSSVVTGGEHIVAHSVVSLGSNAISNITTAVSGSIVTIPNLNVLARSVATEGIADGTLNFVKIGGHQDGSNQTAHIVHVSGGGAMKVDASDSTVTFGAIRGTVTIGNTVTIAGTVTANPTGTQTIAGTVTANLSELITEAIDSSGATRAIAVHIKDADGNNWGAENIFPVVASGTVTANIGSVLGFNEIYLADADNDNKFSSSYPFPISGTVTANALKLQTNNNVFNYLSGTEIQEFSPGNPVVAVNASVFGALPTGTNRIGVVTIGAGTVTIGAGTAQIGSVTASISNSVTIASLPAISGTVTANLAISSSAITSGSFTSLTSATLVPANTARKMATVYNLGAGQLFINAGASATTLGGGFMVALSSGDYFECPFTTTTLSAIFATAGTASWVSH